MAENNNESINMQFIEAIENGNTELVKELLADPRIDINFKTKKGEMTPLMYACSGFDNEEIVKLLLAVPGIDVNLTSKNFGSDCSICR
jgi:ankyrin repeat protein